MTRTRAAPALLALAVVAVVVVSGGSSTDPRTPPGLPGLPPPFFATAVVGSGQLTAAIDAYGDVVDLRAPGPAGAGLIDNPVVRQAAGTVPPDTGIVPRVSIGGGAPLPLWRGDQVRQHYLRGTNVLRTEARFGPVRVEIKDAAQGQALARTIRASAPSDIEASPTLLIDEGLREEVTCDEQRDRRRLAIACFVDPRRPALLDRPPPSRIIESALRDDRRWIARAQPLGAGAPAWARGMYERSLLVLRAFTDQRTGAVAAGARDGWAYVWPRDAGAVAIALAVAGYRAEARQIARFLLGLELDAAARFQGDGTAVEGRGAQGDARGWTAAAAEESGLYPVPGSTVDSRRLSLPAGGMWRDRSDYQEKSTGNYLGNALASLAALADVPATSLDERSSDRKPATSVDGPKSDAYRRESAHRREGKRIQALFGTANGLSREAGVPDSGVDSAAAWAVRPFTRPALFPLVRRSLQRLLAERGGRFGIVPSENWPGKDPWTAPTAWTAWALAALPGDGDRTALRLLASLRRAATPAGLLPERIDARTGVPRSTTPLAWSHAFAVLALRQLWP